MALTGAVAAAVRQFDPYPEFDNVRVFKGRPEAGGRPFYKAAGLIVPRFEMVPGVQIVGGAGFGQREINAAWRGVRADEPLIGDGGLRNAELRANSIRNPTFQNPGIGTPGSDPSYMNLAVQGLTRTILGRGEEFGLPYLDVRISGTNTGSTQPVTWFLDSEGKATVPGQTWTHRTGFRVLAGNWTGFNSALLRIYEQAGSTFLVSSVTTSLLGVGASFASRVREHTVAQPTADNVRAVVTMGVAVGGAVDITLRMYAPQFKLGPDINDPPILQESGLPATRTGYGNFETGRRIAPLHYGVARARWLAPLANHEAAFPHLLELRDGGGIGRALWYASKAGGATRITAGNNGGGADPVIALSAPVIGEWSTIAWAVRGAELAVSEMGGAVQVAAMPAPPPLMTRMGHLGSATTPGNNTANAEMDCCLTANGEISNAALQALSARFAA